jgi:hypothetical protein
MKILLGVVIALVLLSAQNAAGGTIGCKVTVDGEVGRREQVSWPVRGGVLRWDSELGCSHLARSSKSFRAARRRSTVGMLARRLMRRDSADLI